MSKDPAIDAAERAWVKHFTAQGMPNAVEAFGESYGTYDPEPWLMAEAAREALAPIRELVEDQRLHGRGPHSQEWWDGVSYILGELTSFLPDLQVSHG